MKVITKLSKQSNYIKVLPIFVNTCNTILLTELKEVITKNPETERGVNMEVTLLYLCQVRWLSKIK